MNKLIVEVGSTVTKVDLYNGENLEKVKDVTIYFKKNYKEENKLSESDVKKLIELINDLKNKTEDIYVCGTSIFRTLKEEEKENFLTSFKNATGYDFHIISDKEENELTVYGVANNINEKVCVFIGGGGSTEISVYDKEIIESINTPIGVVDVMEKFPDLANDIASTSLEEVKTYIKERLNLPKNKCYILILAGGAHKYFALTSGIKYEENTLYKDKNQPIMMDIKSRKSETKRFYEEISLDNIRTKVEDPNWWFATRAMCAFALVVGEAIDAKYIIPTDIGMAYGIINKQNNEQI